MRQHGGSKGNAQENSRDASTDEFHIFDYEDPDDTAVDDSDTLEVFDWDGTEKEDVGAGPQEDLSASRPRSVNRRLGSLLVFELGALSVIWIISQAPWNGYVADLIAAVWTVLAFLTLATFGVFVCAEYLSIKRIRRVEACRRVAKSIGAQGDPEARWLFLDLLNKAYPQDSPFKRDVEKKLRSTAVTDAELRAWLEHQALASQDAKCRRLIKHRGIESGTLVTFSFSTRLDVLLVLWRALALIFAISDIYGVRGGLFCKVKILKSVLMSLAFVGVTQYVANAGPLKTAGGIVEWGAKWAKLDHATQAIMQGVGAGLLITRIGASTMRVSRPVALPDSQYQELLNAVARSVRSKAPNTERANREGEGQQ